MIPLLVIAAVVCLTGIAAACNAKMDKVAFHFDKSIYAKKNRQWYDPSVSWLNKNDKQLWLENKPQFIPAWAFCDSLSDFWHLQKTIMIFCLTLPTMGIGGFVWILIFNRYFNHILKSRL